MCVDLECGKVNAAPELEGALGRGVAYVLAIDTRDAVKDVTRRYAAAHYMTQTRETSCERHNCCCYNLKVYQKSSQ